MKRTIKRWEKSALLRLGNLKCQAVLVGSWSSTHTKPRLPRWERLGKPASLHATTGLLAVSTWPLQPYLRVLCVLWTLGHRCNCGPTLRSMRNCIASSKFVWINIGFAFATCLRFVMSWLLHCSLLHDFHCNLFLSPMCMFHLFVCRYLLCLNSTHNTYPTSSLLWKSLCCMRFSSCVSVFICCSPGHSGCVVVNALCCMSMRYLSWGALIRTIRDGDCDLAHFYCWLVCCILLANFTMITFVNFFHFCFLLLLCFLCYSSSPSVGSLHIVQSAHRGMVRGNFWSQ